MARDYKAEYEARVKRGEAAGLTRSQARGHKEKSILGVSERDVRTSRKARMTDKDIAYIVGKRGGGKVGAEAYHGMLRNVKKKGHMPKPDEPDYAPGTIGQLMMDSPRVGEMGTL